MKRILIFSLAYYPHVGGAEVALKEITDRISGIEFHMVTLNFGGEKKEERIGNIFVHRVGNSASYISKILFVPRAALCAARLHRQRYFDAFWAMMSYMLFPIVLLRWFVLRVPYLFTLQEGDPWEHIFSRWFILPFRPMLSIGFKNASAVQAISTYLATWARRMGYQGDVQVIPNGVDAERFAQAPAPGLLETIRTNIKKNENKTWLIHTGRLVHKNALDVVIRALPFLPISIHFFMLGDGHDKSALAKLANDLDVSTRVHFHPYVPLEDIPNYLKACDIFIRPSRSEGMGNSFIEAMAAGLPVIATQEGGIADFLFDARRNPDKETTGWAVDKNSTEQIAAAVKDILAHPEQVARVTATAKKMAIEKYDWNLIAKQMQEKVLERVLV
ncbi:glycosyltransferase family 4 protein [Candidatus Kaiserbacteria bacterium]|nr:glycosyltransferase family 4 protein [Candidatus Kaiserbacteria bacterium]